MKILNPEVSRRLEAGLGLRLNFGSGERRPAGFFNLDCTEATQPDILADLNEPLCQFPDNCVDEIYARHTLEHIDRLLELLAEMHRITRPGGRIEVITPHFSNPYGYSDPTHVRFFGLYSFFYFCSAEDQPRRKVPSFYTGTRFRVESVRFNLLKESLVEKVCRWLFQPWINLSIGCLDWYERRMCRLLPVNDVRYVLSPVKTVAAQQSPRQSAA